MRTSCTYTWAYVYTSYTSIVERTCSHIIGLSSSTTLLDFWIQCCTRTYDPIPNSCKKGRLKAVFLRSRHTSNRPTRFAFSAVRLYDYEMSVRAYVRAFVRCSSAWMSIFYVRTYAKLFC